MRLLTAISWVITTGNKWWSGTNSRVDIEIYRDNLLIERLMLEPGNTSRLTRGTTQQYRWEFRVPVNLDNPLHSTKPDEGFPDAVIFDDGMHEHLKVKLVAKGDNAWEKTNIESTVFGGDSEQRFGVFVFVPKHEDHHFPKDVVISDDFWNPAEGHKSWTLKY